MLGSEIFEQMIKDLSGSMNGKRVSSTALALHLGISTRELRALGNRELTANEICRLISRRARAAEQTLCYTSIQPIIEFFELEYEWTAQGASARLFPLKDDDGKSYPYLKQLCERLKNAKGVYVFHDSRGRAIYAGKAVQQSLWDEMNNAYNRKRGDVQSIKRADHPRIKGTFGATEVQIKRREICLWEMASYMSAYEVHPDLIGKMEAFIIRAFANDLLNVRMEHF